LNKIKKLKQKFEGNKRKKKTADKGGQIHSNSTTGIEENRHTRGKQRE
jgi:hypothetical protein